jgi:hypothetical protein
LARASYPQRAGPASLPSRPAERVGFTTKFAGRHHRFPSGAGGMQHRLPCFGVDWQMLDRTPQAGCLALDPPSWPLA